MTVLLLGWGWLNMLIWERLLLAASGVLTAMWSMWNGTKDGSLTSIAGTRIPVGMSITLLDNNNVLATWMNGGGSNIECVAGTISGKTITWGSIVTLSTTYGGFHNTSVIALSTTQAIVSFCDSKNSNSVSACVINVTSQTTCAFGAVFSTGNPGTGVSLDKLTSTTALLTYGQSGTTRGQSVVLSVSSSIVTTPGATFSFNSTHDIGYCAVSCISATQALVVYWDVFSTSMLGQRLDISAGTTIAGNTPSTISGVPNSPQLLKIAQLTTSSFSMIYSDNGNGAPQALGLTLSGTTVTNGTKVNIYNNSFAYSIDSGAICRTSSNTVMYLYNHDSDNLMYGVVGSLSGNIVTLSTPVNITTPITAKGMVVVSVDGYHLLSAFQDVGNSLFNSVVLSII